MNIDAIVDANATIDIDDVNRVDGVDEYHQLWRTVVLSLIHRSINKDNLIIKYWKLCKLELYCCFVDKQSDKSAMQHREYFVEMNIDAIVDANATIGIDDVNRVDGVDEYHQLWRTIVFVEVSTIMKTF